MVGGRDLLACRRTGYLPQQDLYFFPLPHGQGSFRPTLGMVRTGWALALVTAASAVLSWHSRLNPVIWLLGAAVLGATGLLG